MIWTVLKEYGISWVFCRGLYSVKLKMLQKVPAVEKLFEKKVSVKRSDILCPDTISLKKFIKELPDEMKEKLITDADNASKGKILGFSAVGMDYGNPINWQYSPLTQKSCDKNSKWFKIPDFDPERGDIKAVWEISRFSHFVTFARVYLLTEDKKYYYAFSEQLENWLSENPYSFGANYKCGQECALRMMNTLLAYSVFKELATKEDEENIKILIERCYRKIISNFFYAYRCIKNNHTISELAGMIVGAWCCEDKKTIKKAYKILDKVIAEQFLPDGGYRQFSFNYQRLALQDLEFVLSLSTGYSLSDKSKEVILKSAEMLYQCQDENGDVPNYGSNDGALIFPVTSCSYRDFRPIIGSIFAILKNEKIYPDGPYNEEFLWFGKNKDLPYVLYEKAHKSFYDSGFFTFKNDKSHAMVVLNDYTSRPAHMDQLHFELWVNGVNVFCDCGTYSYADPAGEGLALTGGHNTVKIKDKEQMSKHGAFMIYNWSHRGKCEFSDSGFSGEMISANGYRHARSIEVENDSYIITDSVYCKTDTEFEVLFHTPCDVEFADGKYILSYNGTKLCTMECSSQGNINKALRSLYYLKKEEISLISMCGKTTNGKAETKVKIKIL